MSDGERLSIVLIEDDPALALGLSDALQFEGYAVRHHKDGRSGLTDILAASPACVLLDVMLPDINGYQVCRELRSAGDKTPVLMLTARGQEADKIRGLDVGADDYVTKPFSVGELLARVRALLRRNRPDAEASVLKIGCAHVDLRAQTIVRDGVRLDTTFYEIELLKLLLERAGIPVSRDEILDRVWGERANPSTRTVDNFVVRLRKKLEPVPDRPCHILTVYGFGYKLVI